ncbi:hypothetical protein [Halomonas garicola]|uniref:hypothetical protein n=1 Tax=Halomonas garicola TaxID=1690008 RepID=UPI00289F8C2D|nr:hypothetical protein [Halomonas garicola]
MEFQLLLEKNPLWISPSFSQEEAVYCAEKLQKELSILSIKPVGFPYALFQFSWEYRNWSMHYTELLFCLVDRCHGVSASLEAAPLSQAPANIICPPALFDISTLEHTARRQAMQVQRGRLRRRSDMRLVDQKNILKPLWRIDAELPGYDKIKLLIDGLSGGYYLLEGAD